MSFNDIRRARLLFFQALYQMHMSDSTNIANLAEEFSVENKDKKYDHEFFLEMVASYPNYSEQIDNVLTSVLKDNIIAKVSPVELSICRLGVFELLLKLETPYKVIITESLRLQKKYGTEDGYRLVNGVLDSASKVIRQNEI